MSPRFSLRRWLTCWKRKSALPGAAAEPRGRRPLLETLETRLPPGDLFGLAIPDMYGLLSLLTPVAKPHPLPSSGRPTTSLTPDQSKALLGSAAALNFLTQLSNNPSHQATTPPARQPVAQPLGTSFEPFVVDTGLAGPTLGRMPPSNGAPLPTDPGLASSGGGAASRLATVAGAGGIGAPAGGTPSTAGLTALASPPSTGSPTLVAAPQQMVAITGLIGKNGQSVAGQITNYTTPTALGVAPANSSVDVSIDGKWAQTVKADAKGSWSFQSAPLAQGPHQFTAVATGSQAVAGMGLITTIDTVAPTVTLTGNDFVASRDAAWVKAAVTSGDNYGYNPMVHVDVDLKHDGLFTDPGDQDVAVGYAGSQFNLPRLAEGTYNVQARVIDYAGNVGTSAPVTMQFDPNAGFIGSQYLRNLGGLPPLTGGPGGQGMAPPPGKAVMPIMDNASRFDSLLFIDSGNVKISVRATLPKYLAGLQGDLKALGFQTLDSEPSANMVTGYFPIANLARLDQLAHLSSAVPVYRPELRTGSVESEGDAVMKAPAFRAAQGVDGTGVTVGVLSDSVNQFNNGLADSIKTGDLPNNVNVLQDDPNGNGTDEGRAMLEIIHDVAPGSPLAFHTAYSDPTNFAAGIVALQAAGAKVITDDVSYADAPIFNDGRIAQAVDQVAALGVVYTSAAGNSDNQAYRADWNPITATVDTVTNGTFQNFGGSALQNFTLATGDTATITFQWDNAFLEGGDPAANFQVGTDMAVYVVDTVTNKIVATQDDVNANTDEAVEFTSFTNSTTDTSFAFAFQLKSGTAPTKIAWIDFGSTNNLNAKGEGASTIFGQTVAKGAIAVAATPASNPTAQEPFSALGGALPILFDSLGNRLATPDVRQKPELTAPDGVHTSFFGSDDGNGGFQFFGTSAAAPHAAAAAALLLQQAPGATNTQVETHLEQTALDLLSPGYDNLTGFGLIQLAPLILPPSGGGPTNLSGDIYDPNDTSDTAANLGNVSNTTISNLTIANTAAGLPNYDWFKGTTTGGTFTATLSPQAGSGKLEEHVFTLSNGFLTEVGSTTVAAGGNGGVSVALTNGQTVYVEVKGAETSPGVMATGAYNLSMKVV